ncbi:TERF1-interacting nuclear factor 2-like isoform X3 [Stegostoma tigrinum]|uniref:TERF1-interacting nuclear factor 2-like isoform X3 n=1 Tax=Stegostoma tigrinum TaxID=3053191 RepID=UPI0028709898|nr:TERF1-interacting nuclear factor 2-like isoform X3 [Stegostoma tigrinum]
MFADGSSAEDIQVALARYFPEGAPASRQATACDSQKVREIQAQFQELVSHLLRDDAFRTSFLQDEMPKQYGEEFLTVLQKLLWEYLLRLDGTLPRLRFEQLRVAADPSDPRHAEFLIGCLRDLDPQSLHSLAAGLGMPDPQGGVTSNPPAAEEKPESPRGCVQGEPRCLREPTGDARTGLQQARGLRELRPHRGARGASHGRSRASLRLLAGPQGGDPMRRRTRRSWVLSASLGSIQAWQSQATGSQRPRQGSPTRTHTAPSCLT